MKKYKLEYIWLDGKTPIPELRGKTTVKAFDHPPTLGDLPTWGFDGSSTMQAEGKSSDCMLKPVALYPDASRKDGYIVMSEVMLPDGTPHPSNMRAKVENDPDFWKSTSCTRTGGRLDFPRKVTRVLKVRTTAVWATNIWAAWLVKSSMSIWTFVWPRVSITMGSTRKWPRANGNSRFSAKARRKQLTTPGPLAI
jgi:hypothetical protein